MAQRKKTPDILGDLLGSKHVPSESTAESVKQQTVLPAKLQNLTTVNRQNTKTLEQQGDLAVENQNSEPAILQDGLPTERQNGITVRRQTGLPVKQQLIASLEEVEYAEPEAVETEAKTKMTFYLSEDSVELLEDTQRILRRMAKKAGKVQPKGLTSKSALLEAALKIACDELEDKGEESSFARLIL